MNRNRRGGESPGRRCDRDRPAPYPLLAMRRTAALLLVLAWVSLATATEPEFRWEPLPASAAGEILLTGADSGFVRPNGCMEFLGGSFVRPGFERWLRDRAPGTARIWVGTGDLFDLEGSEAATAEPDESLATLGAVPYALVGVSLGDLERVGAETLVEMARRYQVPLVATNVIVHESGLSIAKSSRIVDIGGRRVGFLSVTRHVPERIWTLQGASVVTVDPKEALRREIPRVREDADAVIVLSTMLQLETRDLLKNIEGVDLIVASSGLYRSPEGEPAGSARLYWAGGWGETIGRLVVRADGSLAPVQVFAVRESFPIDSLTGEVRQISTESAP